MDTASLHNNLLRYADIEEKDFQALHGRLEPFEGAKRSFLLEAGGRVEHFYWVMEGCVMAYIVDEGGDKHVMQFAGPFWWTTDLEGFSKQSPSKYHLQCMTKVTGFRLSREDFETLLDESPVYERYFRRIFQNALIAHQKRIMDNIGLSAVERYTNFQSRYPMIEQLVAQKYVASYLGLTPEFLSKMKSQQIIQKS